MNNIEMILLRNSVLSIPLLILILAVRRIIQQRYRWIMSLFWGIFSIRLFLPASWISIFSLPAPVVLPSSNQVTPSFHRNIDGAGQNTRILFIIWIIGLILMVSVLTINYWKLKDRFKTSIKKENGIYFSDQIIIPVTIGIFHPRILVPFSISDTDYKHVLLHEQAHIQRKDNITKLLGYLILSIYWFNPFIWLSYYILCKDIEIACDEYVISRMNSSEKAEYCKALLFYSLPESLLLSASTPFSGKKSDVVKRIQLILNYSSRPIWKSTAMAVLISIPLCLFLFLGIDLQSKEEKIPFHNPVHHDIRIYDQPTTIVDPDDPYSQLRLEKEAIKMAEELTRLQEEIYREYASNNNKPTDLVDTDG